MTPRLYTITLPVSGIGDDAGAMVFSQAWAEEDVFSSSAHSAGKPGQWIMTWILNGPSDETLPDRNRIVSSLCVAASVCGLNPADLDFGALDIAPVPDRDWLAHVHESHPPFAVGKFFVYGSQWAQEITPPETLIPLEIDAASAFGSGEHGTTAGCLEALGLLADKGLHPRQSLDMGTGSGILAIAAWKLWKSPVLAVDIDRESVRVACLHRSRNAVPATADGMIGKQGGSFSIAAIRARAPFDLIIANILAAPLKEMAGDLAKALAPTGYAILSGMLCTQADDVAHFYAREGLSVLDRLDRGEWATLILGAK